MDMKVKGIMFTVRKNTIVEELGEERWEQFIKKLQEEEPYFEKAIVTSSLIPVEKFAFFIEKYTEEFFNGDERSIWASGERGAEWAFYNGPYKSLMAKKDLKGFVEQSLPLLWDLYFVNGGRIAKATMNENKIEVAVHDIPFRHKFIELTSMAFVRKALELLSGKKVVAIPIKQLEEDGYINYEFVLKE